MIRLQPLTTCSLVITRSAAMMKPEPVETLRADWLGGACGTLLAASVGGRGAAAVVTSMVRLAQISCSGSTASRPSPSTSRRSKRQAAGSVGTTRKPALTGSGRPTVSSELPQSLPAPRGLRTACSAVASAPVRLTTRNPAGGSGAWAAAARGNSRARIRERRMRAMCPRARGRTSPQAFSPAPSPPRAPGRFGWPPGRPAPRGHRHRPACRRW